MLRLTKVLMAGCAVLALAACGGGAEVASPGEGNFGNGGNTGGGNTGGGTTPPPGTPAASCPTGTTNVGTVANGTLRACQLPNLIVGALALPNTSGLVYAINGVVQVGVDRGIAGTGGQEGILSIDPGVRLFASQGSDALIVNRGSQLFAEGTATNPIIFTSRQNIEGQTTENSQGQWGGIVLAGRAPQANCQLTAPVTCTGFVEGGTQASYGGNTPADSSGRLRYVQIRFSGFEVSPGNELQGLTTAGVGSGTVIEYIQVYNSSDDGIEIFGGTHNLRYIVINGADDDGLDTDTGWRGGAQFGIVTQRPTTGTSRSAGFEFSAAPTSVPIATRLNSQPKISNFTLVGRQAAVNAHTVAHFDSGSDATVINSVFTNPTGSLSGCLDLADADTVSVAPSFNSVFMSCAIPFRTQSGQAANVPGVFNAGTNNTSNGTSTLQAPASGTTISNQDLRFINGANENAVTVTNAPGTYSAFTPVTFIGAVQNQSDTWWRGWTCGLTAGLTC